MVCRVCKRELQSPVCSFCGEDNTPYIQNMSEKDPLPKKTEGADKNIAAEAVRMKKPKTAKTYRVKSTYYYDKKKIARNIIVLIAIIALISVAVKLIAPKDKPKMVSAGKNLFSSGMAAVGADGEWGYVNAADPSVFAIAPQFSHVTDYHGDYAAICIAGKYALIDKAGNLICEPKFEGIGPFSDNGLIAAKSGGKWGYIDNTGEFVIEAKFSSASAFGKNKTALVSVSGSYGYIGEDGEYTIAPQYDMALSFSGDSLAPVKVDGKWGYIDEEGTIVIEPKFEEAFGFADGFASVKLYGDYGMITTEGQFAIEPQFDERLSFSGDYARVRVGDKYGLIDKNGKYVINPAFGALGSFDAGEKPLSYAKRGDGKYGFIDISGKYVISPVYEDAKNFSGGLAPVKTDGLWGYIDKEGNEVIEAKYADASEFFDDGYAYVTNVDGSILIIDTTGKIAMLEAASPINNILK